MPTRPVTSTAILIRMDSNDLLESGGTPGGGPQWTPGELGGPSGRTSADLSDIPPSQRGIRRRPLVSLSLLAIIGAAVALLAVAAVGLAVWLGASTISVPVVTGLSFERAEVRLRSAGLVPKRGDDRFSAQFPKGTVMDQDPEGGSVARKGTIVVLAVSAGSETFDMPDVVGKSVSDARRILSARGLAVRVEVVPSEAASDTVIATVPAPGAPVTTSDVVRLTVAGEGQASSALLPYRMEGLSFVIDPTPVASGTVDAPLEVARRLRSLLEASGATVTVTRSAADPDPTLKERVAAARDATATAVIGLSVAKTGEGGVVVSTPPDSTDLSPFTDSSVEFAQSAATELRVNGRVVNVTTGSDTLISQSRAPGARVKLGSAASREDALAFRDPRWADEVARSVYRALGEVFARR